MPKKQIAKKAVGLLDDLWWHGSDTPFRTFDDTLLGTGEGGRDSAFGFFFGKSPKTAQSYLPEDMTINPELFNQTFGMPLSDAEAMRSGLLDKYAKSKGISVEDAVGYSHPDAIIKQKYKLKPDELASRISALDAKLNPYHYETGAYGKPSKDWLNKSRQGYLMGANIPDMQDMKIVDMSGEAWDEGKQALIARMARDEGYSGVVFKNMVDDAFSGSGADDIALVFDTKDISTQQVRPVNMPDVDFNKLKSGAIPTVGAGALGQILFGEDEDMY